MAKKKAPAMRKLRPDELERTAYHEAGHATVALMLIPEWVRRAHIVTMVPKKPPEDDEGNEKLFIGGGVEIDPGTNGDRTSKLCKDRLAVLAASVVAETTHKPELGHTLGCIGDRKAMVFLAFDHICMFGLNENKIPIFYGAMLYGLKLTHREREEQLWEEVERLVREAHDRAEKILKGEANLYQAIAQGLWEDKRLSKRRLLALKRRYGSAKTY